MARKFLEPQNATHRQYEALRAYFVERLAAPSVAQRFGYTPGSLRGLVHQFRADPDRQFFVVVPRGRGKSPTADTVRDRIVELRKQNCSIYDIHRLLLQEGGVKRSPAAVAKILSEQGFAKLPRRADEERPPTLRPTAAEVADARVPCLQPREFRTQFGGLFLFLPYLAKLPFDALMRRAGLPGSKMVPAAHAMRSLLALKLQGSARRSHVMSHVFDEGLALFAGLNVIPKRSFLTEYSCRINPACYPVLMRLWFDAIGKLGLARGVSFDLDFHTIPFHGEDALVEKHYISRRSRRQKGLLAFLARDAEQRVFCYANAEIRKADQDDEVLRFLDFWKKRTGHYPEELVFDSRLTTYRNLHRINKKEIDFITLRRRSRRMLAEIRDQPPSAWRRIKLKNVSRQYSTPRILDRKIALRDYEGSIREIIITDLGHEEPTVMLTNQLRRSAPHLVGRYAQRMLIENAIADGVDFFHMDALSSAVAMKVNCDLQLTLMASSLYRLLGAQIGHGYEAAKSRHIFRDFIDAAAHIQLGDEEIVVRFQRRAHNPLLLAAGFQATGQPIPWLGGRVLRFQLG